MKKLIYGSLMLLLSSCTGSNGNNQRIDDLMKDTVERDESDMASLLISKNQNENNDGVVTKRLVKFVPLESLSYMRIDRDTLAAGWNISSRIDETIDPKEYVTCECSQYRDIDDHLVDHDCFYYGRTGRIVFEPVNTINEKADTVYINREILTRFLTDSSALKKWALYSLDFKEVRNDSIIFLANLGLPDTGFGCYLELKFSKHNPVKSLVVEDVTYKIWPPDDDEE